MNKNSRAARKKGFSNMAETTVGTGTSRQIVARHAEPIFKGSACDTAWNNKNSKHKNPKRYKKHGEN
jgi:IS4 transposase